MKTVTIKGVQYPVRFDMAAFLEAEQFADLSLGQLLDGGSLTSGQVYKLYYLGLKSGADVAGRRLKLTYNQFVEDSFGDQDLADEFNAILTEDFKVVGQIMKERIVLNEPSGSEAEDEKKRTPTGDSTVAS